MWQLLASLFGTLLHKQYKWWTFFYIFRSMAVDSLGQDAVRCWAPICNVWQSIFICLHCSWRDVVLGPEDSAWLPQFWHRWTNHILTVVARLSEDYDESSSDFAEAESWTLNNLVAMNLRICMWKMQGIILWTETAFQNLGSFVQTFRVSAVEQSPCWSLWTLELACGVLFSSHQSPNLVLIWIAPKNIFVFM